MLKVKTLNGFRLRHPIAGVTIGPNWTQFEDGELKPWQEDVIRGDCRLIVEGSKEHEKLKRDLVDAKAAQEKREALEKADEALRAGRASKRAKKTAKPDDDRPAMVRRPKRKKGD